MSEGRRRCYLKAYAGMSHPWEGGWGLGLNLNPRSVPHSGGRSNCAFPGKYRLKIWGGGATQRGPARRG